MTSYTPPLRDMRFVLHELLDVVGELQALPTHSDIDAASIDAMLEQGGKFASTVLAPLNQRGDEEGCVLDATTHDVRSPTGFKQAYAQYVAAGWPTLSCDPAYGGQGLPYLVNQCLAEMMNAANHAWTLYPSLSHGAYQALRAHGSPTQRALYLPRLTSGEWMGTMCLTEAHCGTDLGLLRTRADPQPDGTYTLSGTKIFISAGEHDLAENIVHLVLARRPDAPAGSRGLSLFVVPKFLVRADGTLGSRNAIVCTRLEHKMGIRGNATAELHLDSAIGTLVGEPNKGLAAMFVMMNISRLGVGMQSLGLTEVAYQNAAAYAKERLQMRSLIGPRNPDGPADAILHHPDVRRMLLTARAYAEGGRAVSTWAALQVDKELGSPDAAVRAECASLVALVTPIIKAFFTDNAWIATSHCLQVFGGHGYIRESGMEQFVRDVRIHMIYEGTNTIQALDLLGRKVLGDNGAALKKFGALVSAFIDDEGTNEEMLEFVNPLAELGDKVLKLTSEIGFKALKDRNEIGAAAVDYLRVCGHLVFAYFWARMAKVALARLDSGDPFYQAKLSTARFYFARLLPETAMLVRTARAGSASLMDMDEVLF